MEAHRCHHPHDGLPLGLITTLEWNHAHVSYGGRGLNWNQAAKEGQLKVFHPNYYNEMLQVPGLKTITLSQARAMNRFPIHEPNNIAGWTKTHSVGTLYGGVLMYFDFFQNNSEGRLIVQQNYDMSFVEAQNPSTANETLHFFFFPGSTKLDGLGPDNLAAYTDMESGRSNLMVVHKEHETFTDFNIWGYDVSRSQLEAIAHDYLGAPSE